MLTIGTYGLVSSVIMNDKRRFFLGVFFKIGHRKSLRRGGMRTAPFLYHGCQPLSIV
jgi:hypothetical protein